MSIDEVIQRRAVTSVYQPIVDLDSGFTVGYEALARGPRGSPFESPERMFAAAAAGGVSSELDWVCRAAALQGALDAGLGRSRQLFVNMEPSSLREPRPHFLAQLLEVADSELDVVMEVTERALVNDPGALIAALTKLRSRGLGVAIDDVGAEPASLALLPFVEPDVIKLDLRLVRDQADDVVASISGSVRADAERRGATILAEGIETREHLDRALVLGARLGQGWLFGRGEPFPAPLPPADGHAPIRFSARSQPVPVTPWALVADWPQRRTTTKRLLMPMSHYIEQRAVAGDPCVVLSAFQDWTHFTPDTIRRYEELVVNRSMVGAIATGMVRRPGGGIRGGSLPDGHPLTGEWAVTVVGPHDAAALIARDHGDAGAQSQRRFDYVITHDRSTVIAAARSLMQYIDVD
ncbi:MAG: EAL domain-containing protein [Ilumatobacteraceae bacterium]